MPDPDLTPAEEQVRRLLADARLVEPMPDDVAARLDRVVADLGRAAPPPVDLAARRRRRTARNLLVAAAAVVVLGVGVSQVDLSTQGDAESSDAGGTASRESALDEDSAGDSASSLAAASAALTSSGFVAEVRALVADQAAPALPDSSAQGHESAVGCDDPAWGDGERLGVDYDGQPGALVLRTPSGDTREVDLYLCGDTAPTRSTTVPAG